MQVTVFGASGRVGRLVVAGALSRGWRVVAFVHSHDPFGATEGLTVQKGDAGDQAAVERAVAGSDAVISALGSWGTPDKNVLTEGMRAIIPAMEARGIARLVTLTGAGALWSDDKPGLLDKLSHAGLGLVAPKILRDSEVHLQLLEASQLDWSCVRSPVMSGGDGLGYRLDLKAPSLLARIPRAAVVRCLLDQVEDGRYRCQAPFIHRA